MKKFLMPIVWAIMGLLVLSVASLTDCSPLSAMGTFFLGVAMGEALSISQKHIEDGNGLA